jgi:hypothetical protein
MRTRFDKTRSVLDARALASAPGGRGRGAKRRGETDLKDRRAQKQFAAQSVFAPSCQAMISHQVSRRIRQSMCVASSTDRMQTLGAYQHITVISSDRCTRIGDASEPTRSRQRRSQCTK